VSASALCTDYEHWPLYWFAQLERAVEDGDHLAAAQAQRELARLGVRVAYGRPKAKRQEARLEP
jgi:hypothetical protein